MAPLPDLNKEAPLQGSLECVPSSQCPGFAASSRRAVQCQGRAGSSSETEGLGLRAVNKEQCAVVNAVMM